MTVVLPSLAWRETPNQSARQHGAKPRLVVVHRWGNPPATTRTEAVSRLAGNVNYMCSPTTDVSAHVVYGGSLCPRSARAFQLVEWQRKAWTQADLNSVSLSVESADAIWTPRATQTTLTLDEDGLAQLARIVGFLCLRAGVPVRWARSATQEGIARHMDLGALGNPNGHTCPTTNEQLWRRFVKAVQGEVERGGYRKRWGRGKLPW